MGDYYFHFYGEAQQNTLYLWNGADDIFPSKSTLKAFFSVMLNENKSKSFTIISTFFSVQLIQS